MKKNLGVSFFKYSVAGLLCAAAVLTVGVFTVRAEEDAILAKKVAVQQRGWELLQQYKDPELYLYESEEKLCDDYGLTAEEYEELHQAALDATEGCDTQYEKIKAITAFVADRIYYDYAYYDGYATDTYAYVYDVYVYKRTVCGGYADLVKVLLNSIGISCDYVSGTDHVYSVAYDSDDDRWIFVDATWCSSNAYYGDNVPGREPWVTSACSFTYFDLSPEEIADISNHEFLGAEGLLYDGLYYYVYPSGEHWYDGEWRMSVTGSKEALEEIKCPATFEGYPMEAVTAGAFSYNKALKVIDMSDTSLKKISGAGFSECSSLTTIIVPDSLEEIGRGSFGGCVSLSELDFSHTQLNTIGDGAFRDCTALESLVIPDNLTEFSDSVFEGCTAFTELDFSAMPITTVGNDAFKNCSNLKEVCLPETVTSIGDGAFYGCAMETIDLSHTQVESIGDGALRLDTLKEVVFPDTLTTIGARALDSCTYLTEVDLSHTQVTSIGDSAFSGCENLKKIDLPESLTTIGESAFSGCSSVEGGEIDLTHTAVTTIGENAFFGWNDVEVIRLPDTVTQVGNSAFACQYSVDTPTFVVTSLTDEELGYSDVSAGDYDSPWYGREVTVCDYIYQTAFDGNGADGGSVNPLTCGEGASYALPVNKFTRDGYAFNGWNTKADGSGTSYADGGTFINLASAEGESVTLYAQWRPNAYTIAFDGNGAESGSMDALSCVCGTEYSLTANTYTRSDYVFKEWNTKADGSGTSYADGDTVLNLATKDGATVKLYAQWEGVPYAITYELYGGTNSEDNPASYTMQTATFYLRDPEREGYTFGGWYKESSYETQVTRITRGSMGEITLYAKWNPISYIVGFDKNGGSGSGLSSMECLYGETYTLSANKYEREGYTFNGWNTKPDGSGTSYADCGEFTNLASVNGEIVMLHAQWKPVEYTITYETFGGSNSAENPTSYNALTETFALKGATKEGYTLAGWYKESSFKNKVTEIKKGSSGNITLYAKWSPIKYTIAFDKNGGTSGKMASMTGCVYGKNYKLKSNAFKCTGYTFNGWNTEADGSGVSYENKSSVTSLVSESGGTVTLYAQWKPTEYKIAYKLGNGTNGEGNPAVYTRLSETIVLSDPVREGYTFGGWYTSSSCKAKYKVSEILSGSDGNITLYAKWTAHKYEITFDGNGADSGTVKTLTKRTYGKSYTLSANKYKRTGYTFTGWNTEADGSGVSYKNKAKVKNLTATDGGAVTLYAQWRLNEYRITYKLNKGMNAEGNPATYSVTDDTIVLSDPVREGYTFKGWYKSSSYKEKYRVTEIPEGSTGNKTLYAKWTVNKYTIAFDGNGADSGTVKTLTKRAYGKSYTLSANKYKRDGYVFMGWNTEADGSGTFYKNKAKVKNLTDLDGETVTLYAQWSLPYINATTKTLYVGKTYTLKLTGTGIASVESSDTSVATVTSKGVVKGRKPGEAIITLTGKDGRTYTCVVTVKKK